MGERERPAINRPQRSNRSRGIPAELLTTELEWPDLELPSSTLEQLRELEAKIRAEHSMKEGSGRSNVVPGTASLFHGPPGTGKTLAATVLGKRVERDLYRVALSSVVSKYIGETEKNLRRVFDRAAKTDCILFFDEADALLGKRAAVADTHDRYANIEVGYLLQQIEDFAGVVILATNHPSVLDDAFARRFQSVVRFPEPEAGAR
jgi:SpoVK/Ycf46/Vps4 family AAA+-type ATPase